MVATVAAAWLLLWAAACVQSEQDFYDFKAVNIRGKLVSLEKYRGSVSVGVLRAQLGGGRARWVHPAGALRAMLPSGTSQLGDAPVGHHPGDPSPAIRPSGAPRPLPTQARGYVAQPRNHNALSALSGAKDLALKENALRSGFASSKS